MQVSFTKLHGCGNDYLFVDCTEAELDRAPEVARILSDRRTGVGSDGLILICPGHGADDFRMEMYNADGSRGEMCGNGIRGLGKYVFDHGLTEKTDIAVATDAGRKLLGLDVTDGRVHQVTVDMGEPILEGSEIPVAAKGQVLDHELTVADRTWTVSCVSMGNPHCVTFEPIAPDTALEDVHLRDIGPAFENHAFFPARVNTEFVRVDSPTHLSMRVWERGSGETMACGTGACAVLVAAALTGRAERKATVSLTGGDLLIEYTDDNHVIMTGPSVEVFSATVDVEL